MRLHQLAVSNYKCFGAGPAELPLDAAVTVLIGRNNAGKSALLDAIEFAQGGLPSGVGRGGVEARLTLTLPVDLDMIGSAIDRRRHGDFRDSVATLEMLPNGTPARAEWRCSALKTREGWEISVAETVRDSVSKLYTTHLPRSWRCVRLRADRDVVPEAAEALTGHGDGLQADGTGATNCIQEFLNDRTRDRAVVERDVLGDLRRVFGTCFARVVVQRNEEEEWEIYLEEADKGLVPVSAMGSGLKTVLLVSLLLRLAPKLGSDLPLRDYCFLIEEPENNLHPALLRRLLQHLRERVEADKFKVVLTTHSSVAIDFFGRDEQAQVLHVVHDGTNARVERARSLIEHRRVVADLDVRPSDLLLANGVVWVEGPSDRLYVRRWIDLFTNGRLQEGVHYQCVFYGGKLLSHLTADTQDEQEAAVEILRLNPNVALLMDSDRDSDEDTLSDTKLRLEAEVKRIGGLAWVTAGREIENYLGSDVVDKALGVESPRAVGKYEKFTAYLDELKSGEGARFVRGKATYAARFTEALGKENLRVLDLEEQLGALVALVDRWNGGRPE